MVDEKSFLKSMAIIKEAFPKLEFNARLWYEVLKDLNGECLVLASMEICKTIEELYPTSNLLAMLRQRTLNITKQKLMEGRNLKLPDDSCDEPPREWKEMLKKLAQGKSIDPIERAKDEGKL
jgi:hypothetical protein